jgi:hypothetical protein
MLCVEAEVDTLDHQEPLQGFARRRVFTDDSLEASHAALIRPIFHADQKRRLDCRAPGDAANAGADRPDLTLNGRMVTPS